MPPPSVVVANTLALDPPPPPAQVPSAAPEIAARWRGHPLWRPPVVPLGELNFNMRVRAPAIVERVPWASDAVTWYAMSVGLQVTPLWLLRDRVGVGGGGEFELQIFRTAAAEARLPFWRMPVTATVHTFVRIHEDLLLLAGGVESYAGARVEGGAATGSYTTRWGWVAKVGAYRRLSDVVAMTFAVGYTRRGDTRTDASTMNVWLGLHAGLRRPIQASEMPGP